MQATIIEMLIVTQFRMCQYILAVKIECLFPYVTYVLNSM